MNKVTIGLDTAKSVFHLVNKNNQGRVLSRKKLKRAQVLDFFSNLPPSTAIIAPTFVELALNSWLLLHKLALINTIISALDALNWRLDK